MKTGLATGAAAIGLTAFVIKPAHAGTITVILEIVNEFKNVVNVTNWEGHGDPKFSADIPPGGSLSCNWWMPWCTSQEDHNWGHFISVMSGNDISWQFWQEYRATGAFPGDFIRHTHGLINYDPFATPMQWDPYTGGNRKLRISGNDFWGLVIEPM